MTLNSPNKALAEKPIQSLEEALDRCRERGMRISKQRRMILKLLWQSKEHLSAREIYDRLNQQGKKICQTSVYQNLAALSKHGIIESVERAEGCLYESITESHSHVNFLDNNKIVNVWVRLPANLIEEVEKQTRTKVIDYRIDFYGYHCPKSHKIADLN